MKTRFATLSPGLWLIIAIGFLFVVGTIRNSSAFERYRDPGTKAGNCSECHGAFSDTNSPKGTVFGTGNLNNKHDMHRDSSAMGTACALCHSSGDAKNPFIGSSDGTPNNLTGLGCSGCHLGPGLRAHHAKNGISLCYTDCHHDAAEVPAPENTKPPYYGTGDTKAEHPENLARVAKTNENWSVGDFLGLDNDGNNLYDAADFACAPYRILSTTREGKNVRITWSTAGGRRDAVVASKNVLGTYSNVGGPLTIPGTGIVTTNYLHIGGATNGAYYYRINYQP